MKTTQEGINLDGQDASAKGGGGDMGVLKSEPRKVTSESAPGIAPIDDIKAIGHKGKRGVRARLLPITKHIQILTAVQKQTYEETAAQYGVSKQRIGQIVRRWRHLLPTPQLPRSNIAIQTIIPSLKKKNRIHVLSFRLNDFEVELLKQRYPEAKSIDRAARDIISKFLSI